MCIHVASGQFGEQHCEAPFSCFRLVTYTYDHTKWFLYISVIFLLIDTDNTCTSTIHTTVYTTENLYMDVTLDSQLTMCMKTSHTPFPHYHISLFMLAPPNIWEHVRL